MFHDSIPCSITELTRPHYGSQQRDSTTTKMVQGPSPELLESIRNPTSLDAQIASLRQIKNELVGHDQRKEIAVKRGLIEPLANILTAPTKAAGKKRSANGTSSSLQQQQGTTPWTQEHELRLQATLILACLANGGEAFVQPLLNGGVGHALVHMTAEDDPPRLVTATLQALRNLTVSAALEDEGYPLNANELVEGVLEPLLSRALLNSAAKQQQKLAAEIISNLTPWDDLRTVLADDFLETLSGLLVANSVANNHLDYPGPRSQLPPPPSNANVPSILSAIAAIIAGSVFRTQSFIHAVPIRSLFGSGPPDSNAYGINSHRAYQARYSLPHIHVPLNKSVSFVATSTAFPALSYLQQSERRQFTGSDGSLGGADADYANAVISWLLSMARSMSGLDRLSALRVLALVVKAVEIEFSTCIRRSEALQRSREREKQLALLAVPLAVQLIQGAHPEDKRPTSPSFAEEAEHLQIQEQACEVLALLIQDSKQLQDAAAEAGAIKRVCPILKQSFDAVTPARPMWSAHTEQEEGIADSCKLGNRGLAAEIRHTLRCRQSALEAVAALTSSSDTHRKAVVDAGVVSCIIDSLQLLSAEFAAAAYGKSKPPQQFTVKDGNDTAVVKAACKAAKSLSRSVSMLRTSLIDAGLAKPVFDLLDHMEIDVQIAATDVCCNLLLDFSPMREGLLHAGVIRLLTEHARQSEMDLRLVSLWALKHLMYSSSKEVKIHCLDELGTGWLVGAIQGEQGNAAADLAGLGLGGVSVAGAGGLSTPNAAGEQVDILNPSTSMDLDEHVDDEGDDEADEDSEVMYDEADGTHYQASQLRSTLHRVPDHANQSRSYDFDSARYLRSVRDKEHNPILQAKRDDLAVQEQALDFVRNMLHGDDCPFLFEHLLRAIGQDKLFSLLSDKLAPITPSSSARPSNAKPLYQSVDLVLSTVHVLVHIANGSPTHKQLLIAQKQLLANWLPHFNHVDRRVRVFSVWAVNSLTWVDDDSDRTTAQQRAKELKLCGIDSAIRGLANDVDLDVRERVKTAVRQLDAL